MTSEAQTTIIPAGQILQAARAAIPNWTRHDREATLAGRWLRELESTWAGNRPNTLGYVVRNPAVDELASAAASEAAEFPAGLGSRIREAENAAVDRRREIQEVKTFLEDAKAQRAAAAEQGADNGLAVLDSQLQLLVNDIRGLESLTPLPTFEELAEHPDDHALAQHRLRAQLLERYNAIRDAQNAIVREALAHSNEHPDGGRRVLLACGQVRDCIDAEAYWLAPRREPLDHRDAAASPALTKWRDAAGDPVLSAPAWRDHLPDSARINALLHLVTAAEPWVPSIQSMLNAWNFAKVATTAPSTKADAERSVKALRLLEETTAHHSELTPKEALPKGDGHKSQFRDVY
ncbi:hypothetical protein [Arthrobacter sp. S39]|uniref:hypothetical protein n=1 Tax=Arthrobacter sp. S39 TaxID=2509720 RepID=UPI001037D524|nr:hypothetical protein [Arthrobacter sp. S39]TAP45627.1 hypothetical protein EYS21_02610 [Arthrobacter sp. S39]